MKHRKIIITGGTGHTAQALARIFGKENHVILLTRQSVNGHSNRTVLKATDGYNITYWRWDAMHVEKHWAKEIEGADIVLNLPQSGIDAGRTIGNAITHTVVPPKLWINVSSIIDEIRTPFTRKIALRMAVVHTGHLARCIEWYYEHTDMEGTFDCAAPRSGNSFAF